MTGKELTDRIINDLEKVVRAKNIARSHGQIMTDITASSLNPSYDSKFSIGESWIALTCDISLPGELARFTQFVNYYNLLVSFSKDDIVNINDYLKQVKENKDQIADTFEKIRNNTNLKFIVGTESKPFYDLIKERADYIHSEVASVDNCYKRLIEKRGQ